MISRWVVNKTINEVQTITNTGKVDDNDGSDEV